MIKNHRNAGDAVFDQEDGRWVRKMGQEDPLQKEMATHSSILAREIPWTKEPGRLQSLGSKIIRCNLETKQQQCVCIT